ncbi:MAG TPA: F0F1 ATP synthase subunit B [Actinomycetota bacterium]|nr:F0F1 ATP synthase subunit B [Actinomycetota bacterium]
MIDKVHSLLLLAAEETEHAEEPSGVDLVLPAVEELIWGFIVFGVVLLILNKILFPKIRQGIEAREQRIQADLEAAESSKASAQTELEQYRAQLADARSEANRIIEEARQQADQVRKDNEAKARKDAEDIVARAQETINAERTRTIQELQGTIAAISIDLAEKVVGRSLDNQAQREFVDAYIRDVAGMGTNGGSTN